MLEFYNFEGVDLVIRGIFKVYCIIIIFFILRYFFDRKRIRVLYVVFIVVYILYFIVEE